MSFLLRLSPEVPVTSLAHISNIVLILCVYVCVLQLEQQRQQLLSERQTFHNEQLKQAEMKVRQQREQQGQPAYTMQHSGMATHTHSKMHPVSLSSYCFLYKSFIILKLNICCSITFASFPLQANLCPIG